MKARVWLICRNCGADIADTTESDGVAICGVCGAENAVPGSGEALFKPFRFSSMLVWYFVSVPVFIIIDRLLRASGIELEMEYFWFFHFHVFLLVWTLWKFSRSNVSIGRIIGSTPEGFRWFPIILIVIPLMLFSVGMGRVTYYVLSLISPPFAKDWFAGTDLSGFQVLYLIIAVPFVEELFFRGVLIHRWSTKWDIGRAVLLSTIVFSILHKNIIGAFMYGFALSVIYIKTKTLIAPIICHILINATALGMAIVGNFLDLSGRGRLLTRLFHSEMLFALLCLIISVPWVIYFLRRNWPDESWKAPYFAQDGAYNNI